VDQLMRFFDRACFNAHYFHGTLPSAELRVRALALLWNFCPSSPMTVRKHHGQACPAERLRALALLWNFCPSSPMTVRKHHGQACPAERLNGKRYADNWLENLLASGSMISLRRYQQNPLQLEDLFLIQLDQCAVLANDL
jgi:hypothetical protein